MACLSRGRYTGRKTIPTTRQTSHVSNFINAERHARGTAQEDKRKLCLKHVRQTFEVATAKISGLVNLVLFLQSSFFLVQASSY